MGKGKGSPSLNLNLWKDFIGIWLLVKYEWKCNTNKSLIERSIFELKLFLGKGQHNLKFIAVKWACTLKAKLNYACLQFSSLRHSQNCNWVGRGNGLQTDGRPKLTIKNLQIPFDFLFLNWLRPWMIFN